MNIIRSAADKGRQKMMRKSATEGSDAGDSDDDDAVSAVYDTEFERNAARGIIVFNCHHVKPMGAKKRVFHLDINTNQVRCANDINE